MTGPVRRAVSVSLGSSDRDAVAEVELLGVTVRIERRGTDGDMKRANAMLRELDGTVDALGIGGADLAVLVGPRAYPLFSVRGMVAGVLRTPLLDGNGLKLVLERRVPDFLETLPGGGPREKRVLLPTGTDRWGLTQGFVDAGYACVFGDLMFALGVPIALRSLRTLAVLARVLLPVVGRLPLAWLYPVGERQNERRPRWKRHFAWAEVVAGDCHFIRRSMPERLDQTIVVTNTTTEKDAAIFRAAGVRDLVTTTPVMAGRSFGTNVVEAALVAAAGLGRPLTTTELAAALQETGWGPQRREGG